MTTVVTESLEVFVTMNPHRLADFISFCSMESHEMLDLEYDESSSVEAKSSKITPAKFNRSASIVVSSTQQQLMHRDALEQDANVALRVSAIYFEALVNCFISEMDVWVEDNEVQTIAMVAITLLHQFSPSSKSRLNAIKLAGALAQWSGEESFDPGYVIQPFTHESPFMYSQQALNYSESLAPNPDYTKFTGDLLEQVVHLMEFSSSSNKECLIRSVLPWCRQFGPLLSGIDVSICYGY